MRDAGWEGLEFRKIIIGPLRLCVRGRQEYASNTVDICPWVISWVFPQTVAHFEPQHGCYIHFAFEEMEAWGSGDSPEAPDLKPNAGGKGSSPVRFSVSPVRGPPWIPGPESRALGHSGGTEGRPMGWLSFSSAGQHMNEFIFSYLNLLKGRMGPQVLRDAVSFMILQWVSSLGPGRALKKRWPCCIHTAFLSSHPELLRGTDFLSFPHLSPTPRPRTQ